ncbi:MAG: SDR family NAD(P)-dependent oxidoreductase [Myxococcota bacterium]
MQALPAEGTCTVLTGATGGIGGVVAERLAKEGHTLILPARNAERAEALCRELASKTNNANVFWAPCDLSSLSDVRRAADEILTCAPRIDVLVNNAGMFGRRFVRVDGLEQHLVVNYLAAFVLTHRLLPRLRASSGCIVNVSGETARIGTIRLRDLNRTKSFSVLGAYAQTKLALILFSRTLAERLRDSGVTVSVLTPGVAGTAHLAGGPPWLDWIWRRMPGPERAGAAVTRRVLAADQEGAPYFVGTFRAPAPCAAYRRRTREALYEASVQLTGLSEGERL